MVTVMRAMVPVAPLTCSAEALATGLLTAALAEAHFPLSLETDPDILLQKAGMAMRKYGMHVVVANELATYKEEVIVVTQSGRTTVRRHNKDIDLEEQLINLLVEKHSGCIKQPEVQ